MFLESSMSFFFSVVFGLWGYYYVIGRYDVGIC